MAPNAPERLDVADQDLRGSRFRNVNFSDAVFTDVNLSQSSVSDVNFAATSFHDVDLRKARFTNVDFRDVEITCSRVDGMRVEGILITELIEVYRKRPA